MGNKYPFLIKQLTFLLTEKNKKKTDLPSVLILIIADNILNDSLCCS